MIIREDDLVAARYRLSQLASGQMAPGYVEGEFVGYLILALLERVHRLEEELHGEKKVG